MDFIDLKAQYDLLKVKINEGIQNVLDHGQYIMGPEVLELEKMLAIYTSQKHAISCSSGTDALLMSLMAIDIKAGDYLITTPFTYIATAEVISLLGAIPEFVDIDEKTFNIDMDKVEDKLRKNPNKYKAIIPVDIFGLLADYKALDNLKTKYNIHIIQDAAQSFGASYNDNMSCSFGDISCTSFFPAKPLGCYGDGGAIFTDSDFYANKLKSIRVHGKGNNKYNNIRLGINGRLDTIQAAILIPKLNVLSKEIRLRNKVADFYNSHLNDSILRHHIPQGNISAWAQYSILCMDTTQRERIISKLKENNIPSAIYYERPLHLQEAFRYLGYCQGDFPVTEQISSNILSLPMHPYIRENDMMKIVDIINEI